MNAFAKRFHFVRVTFGAFVRRQVRCRLHFVNISMAGLACLFAECAVNAVRHSGGFVGMAGGALHLGDFRGMRIVLDRRVTISTRQHTVQASGMLGWIDKDALASRGSHAGLAVARQAIFVLLD